MRAGGDKRGSNKDRAGRKMWLLSTPQFGGNGTTVACVHCKISLTYETVQADRIVPGGSYKRSNIQPSCQQCNRARGNKTEWIYNGE